MIEIDLSPVERETIRYWIASLHERSGHYGDGDVVFPDEAIVENKLDHSPQRVRITRVHLEMILDWADASHGNVAMTVDEILLIDKIKAVLAERDS